ncbi:MAG: ATP-grasp domain-containing protein [Candidatus Omnitrophica bacterium]|nr:ATP-grasp domain-containing protein [Candidatus Omnitrophota bacterium]
MLTVGLTYDLKTDYVFKEDDPPDANAEFDHPSTIDVICNAIKSLGYQTKRIGNINNLLEKIDNLGVDIVFNISEGLTGRNRESQVPIVLEARNIPFVGSDGLTLGMTLDKIMAKKIMLAEKIPTPKFFEARNSENFEKDSLKYPLIVKPRFEGSSKGLSEKSRVESDAQLKEQIDFVVRTYKQPALIEEFIAGSEYTVALIGNGEEVEVFPPVQIKIDGRLKLGDKFYTFNRIFSDRLEYVCPAKIPASLRDELMDLARRTFLAVECRDFGRVDFRIDDKARPYVLEINPLPSLSTEDVFMTIAKRLGLTYNHMIDKIIKSALKRYNLSSPDRQ